MKPGTFREEYIAIIVRELLKGLDYLHMEGKLHRDIKGALPFNLDCIPYLNDTYSRKYSPIGYRRCKAGRLRSVGSAFGYTVS